MKFFAATAALLGAASAAAVKRDGASSAWNEWQSATTVYSTIYSTEYSTVYSTASKLSSKQLLG